MITDVRSESPFWLMKNGFVEPYFQLIDDVKTDFVVIGGGISGALVTRSLARAGAKVVMIDRRHFGMASTCASTALIQHDIDVALHELIEKIGENRAVRSYELSLKALNDLAAIAEPMAEEIGFETRLSLRLGMQKKDVKFIEKEFDARSRHNFDVAIWDRVEAAKHLPVGAETVLLTRPSAIADPFRLTHAMLADAAEHGALLFDKTSAKRIDRSRSGVTIDTGEHKIKAKKLVIACGYESVNYIRKKVGELKSTFAIVSQPLPTSDIWHENASFWTSDDPYSYGRTTPDNRVIFGGYDEPFYDPEKRDALVKAKSRTLATAFNKLFPDVSVVVDYAWAGTFIESEDGLPYIGPYRALDHTYFALGFGGNGITFSQLAADILTDLLLGRKNNDAELFGFDSQR